MLRRPRVHGHDVRCPDCGSNWMARHGYNRGQQRCRCGDCRQRYQPSGAGHRPGPAVREQALQMYVAGSSPSAVSRVGGVRVQTVSNWVKKGGYKRLERLREQARRRPAAMAGGQPAAVFACAEHWTCRGARRGDERADGWIWTAVAPEGDGVRRVDFAVRDRSEVPFLRLQARLPEAERYRSDAHPVYQWFPRNRHVVGQGGAVNWNAGLHSVGRGQLNRLMRRTKGYSKSLEMLTCSLARVGWRRQPKFNAASS